MNSVHGLLYQYFQNSSKLHDTQEYKRKQIAMENTLIVGIFLIMAQSYRVMQPPSSEPYVEIIEQPNCRATR